MASRSRALPTAAPFLALRVSLSLLFNLRVRAVP